jgi:predicted nucleotidyltransferase
MLSIEDKNKLISLAEKYNASKVYLFGSNLSNNIETHDIDIAIDGIADSQFFKFYGELIFALSKPVDLVDLKRKNKINSIIKNESILIYG